MKKKIWLISIICILLCLGVGVVGYFYINRSGITKEDKERLETEEYQAVFASMYDISSFAEADFETYRGLRTVCLQGRLRGFADFTRLKELVFTETKTPQVVYLGIDPVMLWKKAGYQEEKWLAALQESIGTMITENNGIPFEITLPFPKQDYWLELSEAELTESLIVYQKTVDYLSTFDNVVLFFFGAQDWLICNPENYRNEFCLNEKLAHFFLLSTVCDKKFVVNSESMQGELSILANYVLEEQATPTIYPDLSDWEMVFFGDSIIALEDSSSAVPEVLAGFSKATVYDCAKGGISASYTGKDEYYFPAITEAFLTGQTTNYEAEENMVRGIKNFHESASADKRLCFVINFGLNDYFSGYAPDSQENLWDISTYGGALRTGIQNLKDVYPDALIIVATPNPISFYNYGMLPVGDAGYVLNDYIVVARQVAEDMEVICLDNYVRLGITQENCSEYLLQDGVHLNGRGRLCYAKALIELIEENLYFALPEESVRVFGE